MLQKRAVGRLISERTLAKRSKSLLIFPHQIPGDNRLSTLETVRLQHNYFPQNHIKAYPPNAVFDNT